ncbi:MAG: HAMP domain-containing histidine kinase, partial [Acidimicrobiia bacterium]|nr:HAMP domain-containing histidine kinase [Acidimicrobiia bacterium]
AGRRGASEGTGLGLALVREHVTLHGGKVWVEDRNGDGPGARFVVEMPGELSEAEPEPEADLGPAAVPAVEADVVEV